MFATGVFMTTPLESRRSAAPFGDPTTITRGALALHGFRGPNKAHCMWEWIARPSQRESMKSADPGSYEGIGAISLGSDPHAPPTPNLSYLC